MNTTTATTAPLSLKDWFPRRKTQSCLQVEWAGVLRSDHDQLVPEPSDELGFHVANQMHLWNDGKKVVFDENWNPDAWHDSNGYRVVFHAEAKPSPSSPWQQLHQLFAKFSRR